ncbi:MAG: polyphosphate kinase, partial [Nocardioidaceae bacterium]|nr:polyphosphate kinase [Nocardioidaceae bacterium]
GRFLEHSRVYWFAGGGTPEAWIGSADLMHRNLDRRVEVLVRIPSEEHINLLGDLLAAYASDETLSWHLEADASWTRHGGEDIQAALITKAKSRRDR